MMKSLENVLVGVQARNGMYRICELRRIYQLSFIPSTSYYFDFLTVFPGVLRGTLDSGSGTDVVDNIMPL